MNLTDFRNKFLELEESHDLFSKEVNGFNYWQYIRVWVYYELQENLFSFKKGNNKWKRISALQKVKTILHSVFLSMFRNPLINLKPKDILIFTGSRRIKQNGKDFDIYFDEFIEKTDRSINTIEDYFQGNDYKKPATENILYVDFLYIFQKILLRFKGIGSDYSNEFSETISVFESEFKIKLNRNKLYKFYLNNLIEHQYFRKYYRKILTKAKPKVILETVSYGTWKQIFNEEAKTLNIPIVELQHGFMGGYQIPYNFKQKRNIHSFPDYIFTFGEFWNDTTDFPIDEKHIISCGFPHFENNQKSVKQKKNNKFTILFISQPTIAEGLIEIAVELANKLDENKYDIIYKLHPQEYSIKSEMYQQLQLHKNITVTDKNSPDLYHYFNISDAQTGVYSTALIEGLGFNLQTFIADLYGHEWMEDLYTNNYAELISDADQIINQLNINNNDDVNTEMFWKKNALKNITDEIEKLIKKQNRK